MHFCQICAHHNCSEISMELTRPYFVQADAYPKWTSRSTLKPMIVTARGIRNPMAASNSFVIDGPISPKYVIHHVCSPLTQAMVPSDISEQVMVCSWTCAKQLHRHLSKNNDLYETVHLVYLHKRVNSLTFSVKRFSKLESCWAFIRNKQKELTLSLSPIWQTASASQSQLTVRIPRFRRAQLVGILTDIYAAVDKLLIQVDTVTVLIPSVGKYRLL